MKWSKYFVLFAILVLCVSCGEGAVPGTAPPLPVSNEPPTSGVDKESPDIVGKEISPIPSNKPSPDVETTNQPSPAVQTGNTYINKVGGWQITFPASWDGYYEIRETSKFIGVYFTGKSDKAKQYADEYGLDMFFIEDESTFENVFVDSIHELGPINGIKYYFYTSTDTWIGIFDINSEDSEEKKDAYKVKEMYSGYEWIDSIVATFKTINAVADN